ncbi:hypothetical protein UlMin_038874 [Ulmus minor]
MSNSFFISKTLPLFFLLFYFPLAFSFYFNIPRFENNNQRVLYQGDAVPRVGRAELNNQIDYMFQVGRVIFSNRVKLWDAKTRKFADFTTRFSFFIDTRDRPYYAAGLAFFLAPAGFPIPPNSAGGFLGLFNTTTSDSSENHIVHVEFDSFSNGWDPNITHVGINKNSVSSLIYTPWNASFHSGDTADVVINYNATTANLSVSWKYQTTSNSKENTSLSFVIDLIEVLPEWVTIGFSAATSNFAERHAVQSWEFNSSLDFKEEEEEDHSSKVGLAVMGLVVSGVVLIAGVITFIIFWRRREKRRKRAEMANLTSTNYDLERGAGPRSFSYSDLASATNNFSNERKLGEGGFGTVYRGYLKDLDALVAVKKISKGSRQGKKEYLTEVRVISSLRHRNLVQLIGWCHDKGEFLLVYEFMPNGSLDSHLFGNRPPLSWAARYKISIGLASALLYLHEEWEQCVLHRDIKSSNVMLDSIFNVKLGDFGLARVMDHELGPQTTGLVGTLGYLAPEYVSTGRASKESDVYSFGVVVLEITTGRKSFDRIEGKDSEMGLVEWIWDLYGNGNLVSAVDEKLNFEFDQTQAECLMIVGLWCSHPDRSFRPSIKQAIRVLNFEADFPNLPMKMPVPTYQTMHQTPTPSVSSGEPLISTSFETTGR